MKEIFLNYYHEKYSRSVNKMSRRNTMVPETKAAMEQFKMEAANEFDVTKCY